MRRIRRHLSYANVAATLALVFAMTGGAIAASGGFTSGGKLQACVGRTGTIKLLKGGQKCHRGQQKVAWNQTGPRGPAGPSGLSGTGGTIPAKVASAETALTANNALSLGGIPASEFTRRDCASPTGQVKGFATVPATGGFSATFTPVSTSYNCSGGAVEARRLAEGLYEVRFLGNSTASAVASATDAIGGLPSASLVALHNEGGGVWLVRVWDGPNKEDIDETFSMVLL